MKVSILHRSRNLNCVARFYRIEVEEDNKNAGQCKLLPAGRTMCFPWKQGVDTHHKKEILRLDVWKTDPLHTPFNSGNLHCGHSILESIKRNIQNKVHDSPSQTGAAFQKASAACFKVQNCTRFERLKLRRNWKDWIKCCFYRLQIGLFCPPANCVLY